MEAQETIDKMQKLRDKFLKEFLDREPEDLSLYHLVFNNDRNTPERMAEIIARYVLGN
jgi:cytidylate kinase